MQAAGFQSHEDLHSYYGEQNARVRKKEMPTIDEYSRRFIELSPFLVIASAGPGGADASPRGDAPGFVKVLDDRTLALPDRPGNNRVDTLGNVMENPGVALIFLVPGVNETLRVNGRARITTDPEVLGPLSAKGKLPRSAMIIEVETAFFHCGKSIIRSKLWAPETQIDRKSFPTLGQIYAGRNEEFEAEETDRLLKESYENTLY
ncbi:MAG: pyridoxamine 5'-phosphate oxidase family protein [bacterium]